MKLSTLLGSAFTATLLAVSASKTYNKSTQTVLTDTLDREIAVQTVQTTAIVTESKTSDAASIASSVKAASYSDIFAVTYRDGTSSSITTDFFWQLSYFINGKLESHKNKVSHFNSTAPNGLKYWENYVLGLLQGTKSNSTTLPAVELSLFDTADGLLVSSTNLVNATIQDDDYVISYQLEEDGVVVDEVSGPQFTIPFEKSATYKIKVRMTKDGNSYNQFYLPDTFGILKVEKATPNVIAAVPFRSAGISDADPTSLVHGLEANDRIYSTTDYYCWQLSEYGFVQMLGQESDGVTTSSTRKNSIDAYEAVFVHREDATKPFYVYGICKCDDIENVIPGGSYDFPGMKMIANCTFYDVDLNDIDFIGEIGSTDTIVVPSANQNVSTVYIYKDGKWGRYSKRYVNGRLYSTFVEGCNISSGSGFWYNRRSEDELVVHWSSIAK